MRLYLTLLQWHFTFSQHTQVDPAAIYVWGKRCTGSPASLSLPVLSTSLVTANSSVHLIASTQRLLLQDLVHLLSSAQKQQTLSTAPELTLSLLDPSGRKVPKPWRRTRPVNPTGYIGGNVGTYSMSQWFKCFMFYCYRCYFVIWTNKSLSLSIVRTSQWSSAYWRQYAGWGVEVTK